MSLATFIKSIFGYPPELTEAQVVQNSLKKVALDLLAAKADQESVNAQVSALVVRKARLEIEHRRLQAAAPSELYDLTMRTVGQRK